MQAGQLAQLDAPAPDRLEDTTEQSHDLPALAVNATQTDLDADREVQHCTAAARIATEEEQAIVYDGGVTSERIETRTEIISDLVADVTGTGIVLAERTGGDGRYPFPYDMVAAQTTRDLTTYNVDIQDFANQWDDDALRDTWMVGSGDDDGVRIDYNDRAEPENAPDATVGLGFVVSWEDTVGEGVVYESGYVAIYSGWTAAMFVEFVDDAVLPHAYADEQTQQATLGP
jgi:hypothetical protein